MSGELVLCGLGPHARRIYYPRIESLVKAGAIRLRAVVELESQKSSVEDYLAARQVRPQEIIYLPERAREDPSSLPELLAGVDGYAARDADACVISTEPRSHRELALWALRNGMTVLLDKPVTARDLRHADPREALRLYDDYLDISAAAAEAGRPVLVQTQRRAHLGYELLMGYLQEFAGTWQVPITYVDIYHADGMWNMPDEYLFRENHPYKYGYGKLMHSGYHFVDLLTQILTVNAVVQGQEVESLDVHLMEAGPVDHLSQLPSRFYDRVFGKDGSADARGVFKLPEDLRGMGETDVLLTAQARNSNGALVTSSVMSLLQTSFSRRAWPHLPADTYKGNGRVRHERVTVQVGPLLCVQVHSYQSYEARDWVGRGEGAGSYEHFDIDIYRNAELVGGRPFERLALGDASQMTGAQDGGYLGHNEAARHELFGDFLRGDPTRAGLAHHRLPVQVLAASYYSLLSGRQGQPRDVRVTPAAAEWFSTTGRRT